ncbi:ABC transporter permease [Streptomyces europaeiscabiei]|uniref:ABC transporter permease n=1 Tax=Streptomyces europaeiscabiei TaxID=146819 RepID=UPI0029B37AAB|nr:ABC transporter permease [Streptomyces europaeiscabiei]MDX2525293.1 ABC transporter permease [Streptomyces europaeiscabiei]
MATTTPSGRYASRRVLSVMERNVHATHFGPSYWVLVAAGLFEPLFYLFTVGAGIGALIDRSISYAGHHVTYPQYVAPGTLAVSAVSGVFGVSVYSFYNKFRNARVFEVMLTTPLRSFDVVLGELIWAVARSGLFGALFLVVMAALDLAEPLRLVMTFPAVLLVGAAFGAAGMAATTYVRGWQDFDVITMVQTGLMLFSGTFFPVTQYPAAVTALVQALPLYHAIELVRGLALGGWGLALAGHAGYLFLMLLAGLFVAHRRMDRHLRT